MQNVLKWGILLVLFLPSFYFAARQKKWYLYLLLAFIGILPEQFSFRLHESLPLLTVSRMLIIMAAGFWFYDRTQTKKWSIPWAIAAFLGVNLLISLIHLFSDSDEINRMFIFVTERVLVVVMLKDLLTTREEFDRGVDFLIGGSCALAVIGILQTMFDYDVSSVLHLTKTYTSIQLLPRMGLTRAFGTFNAISYGCYCAIMLIPIYYRLKQTDRQRYSLAFALNIMALLCTFTRSAWLGIVGVMGLLFLTQPKKFILCLWKGVVMTMVLCLVLCLIQPKLGSAVLETGKSSANTLLQVLPDSWFQKNPSAGDADVTDSTGSTDATDATEPEETTPEPEKPGFDLSDDFGANASDPAYSRNVQWTAVKYMAREGTLILGYGYNALREGKIHFHYKQWGDDYKPTNYLDVGWVAVIAEGGLIYLLSFIGLLGYIFVQALRKWKQDGDFGFYKASGFIVIYILVINVLASYLNAGSVWLLLGLYFAYENLDKQNALSVPEEKPHKKWQF